MIPFVSVDGSLEAFFALFSYLEEEDQLHTTTMKISSHDGKNERPKGLLEDLGRGAAPSIGDYLTPLLSNLKA
ncbi:hypothetical protein CSUI_005610, partial [Cystoisospora suis]